jgi:hypothetical protein
MMLWGFFRFLEGVAAESSSGAVAIVNASSEASRDFIDLPPVKC